ncbi:MAG: T9SS type A sorting domain-containing protein [Breznakibacter sp.]
MKKCYNKSFLLGFFILLGTVVSAQYDITPAAFQFSQMPLGNAGGMVKEVFRGANPPASYAPARTTEGYVGLCLAPGGFDTAKDALTANVKSAMQIVDLGGADGKVLLIKGKNSKVADGIAATGTVNYWGNLSFYAASSLPAGKNLKYRITYKLKHETISSGTVGAFNSYTYTGTVIYSDAYYGEDTEWFTIENSFSINDPVGIPLRVTFNFPGTFDQMAIYIKDIKIFDTSFPTAIEDLTAGDFKAYGNNGFLVVDGVAQASVINVYDLMGRRVAQITSLGESNRVKLDKGIYMVQVGERVKKVSL